MNPSRLLISQLIALTLVGCAQYQSEPLDSEAEMDAIRSRGVSITEVERAHVGTQQLIGPVDPTDGLDEAEMVSVALAGNPELRIKRAEAGVAQAMLISAGAWPNPEISLSPRWGIDGASGFAFDADALFQLLRPGERSAIAEGAKAGVEAARQELLAEEMRLVGQVRSQRLSVLAAERHAALMEEAVRLREKSAELVRRQRQGGEGTELDVSATELELAESRRDLRKARSELNEALIELNHLLGLPSEYALKITGYGLALGVSVYEDLSDEALEQRLMAGRMELGATAAAYRQAEEELRLAVIRQYPRLSLGPSFEKEIEGTKGLGLALSLELPVFNQNQGEIAEKLAGREKVRAEYAALLARLRGEAFAARASVRRAREEVEAQEREIVPLLKRNQELFEGAYRAREINVITWLTAQQRAVTARREHLEAVVKYARAVIELETAAGLPLSRATTRPATNRTSNIEKSTGGQHDR